MTDTNTARPDVTVYVPEGQSPREVAQQLLHLAGPDGAHRVRTNTDNGLAFIVDADLADAYEGDTTTPAPPAPFDPVVHSVAEVVEYLATADDAERDRVRAAELAGRARKGIIDAGQ